MTIISMLGSKFWISGSFILFWNDLVYVQTPFYPNLNHNLWPKRQFGANMYWDLLSSQKHDRSLWILLEQFE